MPALLRRLSDSMVFTASLLLFGVICLSWTLVALPLYAGLPEAPARRCGRRAILIMFRLYLGCLRLMHAYRLDVDCLRELRDGPPVVLAPNHPSLIDALMIIAHDPQVACVMRADLMNNPFVGVGARLARYIPNDSPRAMIADALAELARGGKVLLFPEGTRTTRVPVNALTASCAIIAKHAGVPIQTLIIEQNSSFLGKGWSLLRTPALPIDYRIRLGRRFDAPRDVRAFTLELERYFRAELTASDHDRSLETHRAARSTG